MFWFLRDPGIDGVGVGFTSAELDFSDPPSARTAEFSQLSTALGVPVAVVRQVHGATVLDVDPLVVGAGPLVDLSRYEADAMVTTRPGVGLAVRVADCVPILLADPVARVVAAVHAGRAGLIGGVIDAALEQMHAAGARTINAWVGPHLCSQCYELPEQIVTDVSNRLGVAPTTTSWGTPALDMAAAVASQLTAWDVPLVATGGCTRTDPDLHSWRRDDQVSGRQIGVAWLA